jgi:hypothetical protein
MVFLRAAASLALLVFVLAGITLTLVENSLPGDALYRVKTGLESARLAFSGDPSALREEFARRRLDEIARLLAQRRSAEVTFEGEVQTMNGADWRVAPGPFSASWHAGRAIKPGRRLGFSSGCHDR